MNILRSVWKGPLKKEKCLDTTTNRLGENICNTYRRQGVNIPDIHNNERNRKRNHTYKNI